METEKSKEKKGKGFSITSEVTQKQKRLKATGFNVSGGKISYNIPKEVKEQRAKEFDKKKKAKKKAKKNKKRNK